MANKKSIQDVDAALDRLHRRLTATVRKIDELRKLRKKIVMGYVKRPEPEGVKVKITGAKPDFDDPLPDFACSGDAPAAFGM